MRDLFWDKAERLRGAQSDRRSASCEVVEASSRYTTNSRHGHGICGMSQALC
jgi:hypothetical protein